MTADAVLEAVKCAFAMCEAVVLSPTEDQGAPSGTRRTNRSDRSAPDTGRQADSQRPDGSSYRFLSVASC